MRSDLTHAMMPVSRPARDATRTAGLLLLASLAMAYGWGWRGSYGHEAGAMLPGALLGMAVCLASGRADWYRRTAVAGLFGAVGWAWGGGLSNMEQTFYVVSRSTPDVLWGFGGIFLVGMLWSGIGSAILALALTEPRSVLNGFMGPLAANGAALLALYLVYFWQPDYRQAVDEFGVAHFHDIKYVPAAVMLVTSTLYWLARPAERTQAGLFVQGVLAWWAGYLLLTRLGGILLAPPHRSEAWGGYIGLFVVLCTHLARRRNRAGLWLASCGALSGGLAFLAAVFITHPLVVRWGPFSEITLTNTWKLTEESFGLFMGLGVAAGAATLVRGNVRPPDEDTDRAVSDQFAAFVLLVAMMWMNLRGNVRDWGRRYDLLPDHEVAGLLAWQWFAVVGVAFTAVALYGLWQVRRGSLRHVLPPTAFGKGALLFLLVLWVAQCAVALHRFAEWKQGSEILVEVSYWLLAALMTGTLFALAPGASLPAPEPTSARDLDDRCWRPGRAYWVGWAAVPLLVAAVALAAMAMQDTPHNKARKRFGPDAYWRQELERTGHGAGGG